MLGKHALKPQEKTTLKITYNTAGRPGPFRKNITINTDAPGQEEIEVEMVGVVREAPAAKIQMTPKKADIGTVKVGSVITLRYTVTNTGVLVLVVRKIYSKEDNTVYFDADRDSEIRIEPGASKQIELAIKPLKPGKFTEVIHVESNARNTGKGGLVIMVVGQGV